MAGITLDYLVSFKTVQGGRNVTRLVALIQSYACHICVTCYRERVWNPILFSLLIRNSYLTKARNSKHLILPYALSTISYIHVLLSCPIIDHQQFPTCIISIPKHLCTLTTMIKGLSLNFTTPHISETI